MYSPVKGISDIASENWILQHSHFVIKQEHKHGTSEFDRTMKIPSEYQARPASMQGMEEYIPSAENLIGVPEFSELDGSGKMVKEAWEIINVSMIVSSILPRVESLFAWSCTIVVQITD